ncbi:hypothetical protein [Agrobacterium pusense]|uniref:hypothetical protein n=1 Tax=Agrobacterium pusense TaxID=648995 RepID=UPI001C6DDAEB|nr:hypothetical protein [Agrobacterium pusense]MBW9069988.1 hypothetical protein [Agrobacterium pusense]MBW9084773.1 hypothetical protein [Agrobacterium pusense]MBW9125353.1 hypothetical protein [Agrobacterium pusense]MBW9137768.1 hypothetical protein [Agrobacterium pusense]
MSTTPETRRTIAQRVIDRATARGTPFDADPAFLAVVEEWIRGDIDLKAIRERYLDILALRVAERRGRLKNRLGVNHSVSSNEAKEE